MRLVIPVICLIFFSTVCTAGEPKENLAVMDIQGDLTESESSAISDKIIHEILKSGEYHIIERSRMADILKEQGFQQTGCTNTECAVEVGQLLGVSKVIFGNISKLGRIYSTSLKMVDVGTGEILKSAYVETKGSLEDVLTEGITASIETLMKPSAKPLSAEPVTKDKKEPGRSRLQTAFAIASAAAAAGFGGAGAWFWKEKADIHEDYLALNPGQQDKMDNYHENENSAYTKAAVFTAIGGALIPTSIVMFILKPKRKKQSKLSIRPYISPSVHAVTVSVSF